MKIRTSILAKSLAWILIAVSGLGLVGSGLLAIGMESAGFYEQTYQEIREEKYATFNDRYSARVLDYLYATEDTNQEYFADKNFRYGVIEADFFEDIESLDLNDKKNYIDSNFNFEEKLELENMHVFQCTINENTYFSSQNPDLLWGHYWISNTSDNWHTYSIDDFLYDVNTGVIFVESAERYYPVPRVVMRINDGSEFWVQGFVFDSKNCTYTMEDISDASFGEKQYDATMEIYVVTDVSAKEIRALLAELYVEAKDDGLTFNWLDGTAVGVHNWESMRFTTKQEVYDMTEVLVEVPASDEAALYDEGRQNEIGYTEVSTIADVALSFTGLDWGEASANLDKEVRMSVEEYGEMYVYIKPNDMKSNTYFILSYQEPGYAYISDLALGETDVFGQFEVVFGTLYNMRYQVFAIFFSCLAVFAAAFIFLCCAAGHKKGQTELVESRINRVPLEVYAGVFVVAEAFCALIADTASWKISGFGDAFWIIVIVTAVLFAGLFLTAAALELITRIKLRVLWKNTICYWIISKLFGGVKQAAGFVVEHTSLVWKAVFVVGVNAIVDFFIFFLVMMDEGAFGLFLFTLKCVVVLLVALSAVSQLKKLKEAGEHMAKGDLTYRVDTKGLLWDFKQHGENLNSVGEGLAIAVDERMKSERFKTELITNVSHDIKTPLTSIINYVDLIQKEEVNNEKIEEYLEVLERQSKRLKKLLEDLLEASKASAGTLQVGFETLEAGVFMVQTVGEFEEKTSAQDLELIIKKPEEPVYINADGRHFWRVIDNLMNNICKYAQPNTRVYINLEATKEEVCITFRNTSRYPLNISSEELMERFVRGDESRHTEGSGLGLAIAQSLMELMHGRFELVVDGDLFKVILVFNRVSAPTAQ